jgi:hypothetical protein
MAGIAFIVLSPGAEPAEHRTVLETPAFDLTVVAVPNYDAAVKAAQDLHRAGIETIELCGGFGHDGAAKIAGSVPGAQVGVVRFDGHPGLQGESGDSHFSRR